MGRECGVCRVEERAWVGGGAREGEERTITSQPQRYYRKDSLRKANREHIIKPHFSNMEHRNYACRLLSGGWVFAEGV
jgi:hypothetical protein